MKTTKTIEIEICDSCGNESSTFLCPRCNAECCDRCSDTVRIAVDLYHPRPQTPREKELDVYSINTRRTHERRSANLCISCSAVILKFLTENSFVKEIVQDSVALD